jgi:charged multivesicular body protein 1
MEEQLFNLKLAAKQLLRTSKKMEKEEKDERIKVKKAIEKGNTDGARIYAECAIRKKNEALNTLRLSCRLDAVSSKVESAIRLGRLGKDMGKMVDAMSGCLEGMDNEKLSKIMGDFEKSFEDVDVKSAVLEEAMGGSMASSTPESEVNELIRMVADEHNLELKGTFEAFQAGKDAPQSAQPEPEKEKEEDDLMARLNQLKAK